MSKMSHITETRPLVPQKRLPFPLSLVPEDARPYLELMRLDKPTGTWLVFWPFAWGLTMAAYRVQMPVEEYIIAFCKAFITAFLMRSFACTVNDIFDFEFDAQVERTKSRPLASGRVSYRNACLFAIGQMIVASAIFYNCMSWMGFVAAMVQLLPLSCLYPLMKRITYWPQAWLGIAINFGFVISWLDVTHELDGRINGLMLASLWCWTILYDTVYACQDKADDVKAGVCSTAILFGSWIRPLLTLFGLTFAITLSMAGYVNSQHTSFFLVAAAGAFVHLVWQYITVDLDDPRSCKVNFVRNGQLGWIVWGGLFIDFLVDLLRDRSWGFTLPH